MVSKAPNRPELLAPAGNFFSLEAALLSGADAVYFGCGRFNARSEAASFEEADLPRIMSAVRRAGAKGYLALNTLIYENEFPAALKLALEAFRTGVDGLILQDIGLARLLRRFLPELPLHASTQMTAGSLSALPALRELGIKRIILPRELSLEDIAALTRKAHELDMETEVFVQGALCVSVSGQCSLSRLRGGRSANRGECAGPCRLPWQLLEDNQPRGACAPCLSPKDQSALTFLERVRETDTDALKIEGRLRQPQYVAIAVREYRRALDGEPYDEAALLLAFNRGGSFTDVFMTGQRPENFLSGDRVGNYGLRCGVVVRVDPQRGWLDFRPEGFAATYLPLDEDVLAVRSAATGAETGSAPVTQIRRSGGIVSCRGFHPDVLRRVQRGDPVFKMTDQATLQELADRVLPALPVHLELSSGPAEVCLKAVLEGFEEHPVTACTALSHHPPLAPERVARQLQKTGGTPFVIQSYTDRTTKPPTLAISALNRLRRTVLERLEQLLAEPHAEEADLRRKSIGTVLDREAVGGDEDAAVRSSESVDSVRVYYPTWQSHQELSAPPQADRIALPADELGRRLSKEPSFVKDWEAARRSQQLGAVLPPCMELRQSAELIGRLRDAGVGEILTARAARKIDGSFDRLSGDFGLNLINSAAVLQAADWGFDSLALSPELTSEQTAQLLHALARSPLSRRGLPLEILVYGRQRAMYMKHCPVGLRQPGCRRCHGHRYALADEQGHVHPLVCHPAGGCRTELLSARPLERAVPDPDLYPQLIFRFIFTDESPADREAIIRRLTGQKRGGSLV